MPYRPRTMRRRITARRTRRRALNTKIRVRRARIGRPLRPHMFRVKCTLPSLSLPTFGGSSMVGNGQAWTFMAQDLPDFSNQWAKLYDQYKIAGVKLTFTWSGIVLGGLSLQDSAAYAATCAPNMFIVSDFDDASVPTGKNELQEYGTCIQRRLRPNAKFSVFLRPKMLGMVYKTSLTTGYAPVKARYLDMSDSNVPHYGLKAWCEYQDTAATEPEGAGRIQVEATYYLYCKHQR